MANNNKNTSINNMDLNYEAASSSNATSKQNYLQQQQQQQSRSTLNRRSHQAKQYENCNNSEINDQSAANEDNLNFDQLEKENEDPRGKQGVGPLGIFFKVWSLVKVTKVRHQQNKLRRQNSEETTNQFRYISADQFNAASSQQPGHHNLLDPSSGSHHLLSDNSKRHQQQQQQQQQSHTTLTDSHFRRAGSQPASLGFSASGNSPGGSKESRRRPTLDSPLPVPAARGVVSGGRLALASSSVTSGTNSSSSGVSSATSGGTLASSTTEQPTTYLATSIDQSVAAHSIPTSSSFANIRRQALAAYKARRTTTELRPVSGSSAGSSGSAGSRWRLGAGSSKADEIRINQSPHKQQHPIHHRQHQEPNLAGGHTGGWASRIRRSATSIIHTDASKYRTGIGGHSNQSSQVVVQKTVNQARTAIMQQQQQHAQQTSQPLPLRLRRVSEPSCDDLENSQSFKDETDRIEDVIDDDEDSNDIYSTPHDSIQSVPSFSGGVAFGSNRSGGVNYPIIKSFSTNSFSQSVRQSDNSSQYFIDSSNIRFKPINELERHNEIEICNGDENENEDNIAEDDDQATDLISSDDRFRSQDSNNSSDLTTTGSHATRTSKLAGSRFFISSSSSEDSNSPNSQFQQLRFGQKSQVGGDNNNNSNIAGPSRRIENLKQLFSEENASQDQQVDIQLQDNIITRPRVELHQGIHYHPYQQQQHQQQPVVSTHRPNFLPLIPTLYNYVDLRNGHFLASPTSSQLSQQPAGRLVATPSGVCAVSPTGAPISFAPFAPTAAMAPQQAGYFLNQFHQPTGGYKKSPSLFEISGIQGRHQRHSGGGGLAKFHGIPVAPPVAPPIEPKFNIRGREREIQQTASPPSSSRMPNSISLHDCKLTGDIRVDNINLPDNYMEIDHQSSVGDKPKQQQQQQQQTTTTTNDDFDFDLLIGQKAREVSHKTLGDNSQSEYKLTQMLLEFGSNPNAKDQFGLTALMHAILADNLPAVKCLIERGVDLNAINNAQQSALDLICSKSASENRLQMLKMLIDGRVDFDITRKSDGTRLLDRLINLHGTVAPNQPRQNKLPYIECLLENGAKLGSSTWTAASGKFDIQLRLLRKLCHDGYFLYKKSSIEPAVYRFEYAIRQLGLLERQLLLATNGIGSNASANSNHNHHHQCWDLATGNETASSWRKALSSFAPQQQQQQLHQLQQLYHLGLQPEIARLLARQIKYQIYLGLSRCERKRKFYKRALEFAHLAILVNSNAYEAFYSKAHILKDLGESDDSLLAIDQTARIVNKSVDSTRQQLELLDQQEAENLMLDRCLGNLINSSGNGNGSINSHFALPSTGATAEASVANDQQTEVAAVATDINEQNRTTNGNQISEALQGTSSSYIMGGSILPLLPNGSGETIQPATTTRLAMDQMSSLEATKQELQSQLEYLLEARRHVAKLKAEILEDKLRRVNSTLATSSLSSSASASSSSSTSSSRSNGASSNVQGSNLTVGVV